MTLHALDALNALIYHPAPSAYSCPLLPSWTMQKARACEEDRKPVHSVHSLHREAGERGGWGTTDWFQRLVPIVSVAVPCGFPGENGEPLGELETASAAPQGDHLEALG